MINWRSDRFWGYVLIGLGVVSIAYKPFEKLDGFISGETDKALTIGLFVLVALIVLIAVYGSPSVKALSLLWVVSP